MYIEKPNRTKLVHSYRRFHVTSLTENSVFTRDILLVFSFPQKPVDFQINKKKLFLKMLPLYTVPSILRENRYMIPCLLNIPKTRIYNLYEILPCKFKQNREIKR